MGISDFRPVQLSATISPCGLFRYTLIRTWGDGKRVLYVMINPSTADAQKDDATIRRCRNLAKQFKSGPYGSIEVVNLFAFRATEVKDLRDRAKQRLDCIGPENDLHILGAARRADLIIIAYGAKKWAAKRAGEVINKIGVERIHHLGLTQGGHPWHPLMVGKDVQPEKLL